MSANEIPAELSATQSPLHREEMTEKHVVHVLELRDLETVNPVVRMGIVRTNDSRLSLLDHTATSTEITERNRVVDVDAAERAAKSYLVSMTRGNKPVTEDVSVLAQQLLPIGRTSEGPREEAQLFTIRQEDADALTNETEVSGFVDVPLFALAEVCADMRNRAYGRPVIARGAVPDPRERAFEITRDHLQVDKETLLFALLKSVRVLSPGDAGIAVAPDEDVAEKVTLNHVAAPSNALAAYLQIRSLASQIRSDHERAAREAESSEGVEAEGQSVADGFGIAQA